MLGQIFNVKVFNCLVTDLSMNSEYMNLCKSLIELCRSGHGEVRQFTQAMLHILDAGLPL